LFTLVKLLPMNSTRVSAACVAAGLPVARKNAIRSVTLATLALNARYLSAFFNVKLCDFTRSMQRWPPV
jgi:hypothetical protein